MDNLQEVTKSVLFAMKRTNSLNLNAEDTANDINNEFVNKHGLDVVIRGIRKGGMGYYGSQKNINTSTIGDWIVKYLKEN